MLFTISKWGLSCKIRLIIKDFYFYRSFLSETVKAKVKKDTASTQAKDSRLEQEALNAEATRLAAQLELNDKWNESIAPLREKWMAEQEAEEKQNRLMLKVQKQSQEMVDLELHENNLLKFQVCYTCIFFVLFRLQIILLGRS